MAQAAGVNSGAPNNSGPVQVPPQNQPVSSQKPDPDGNSAQPPPGGKAINFCCHHMLSVFKQIGHKLVTHIFYIIFTMHFFYNSQITHQRNTIFSHYLLYSSTPTRVLTFTKPIIRGLVNYIHFTSNVFVCYHV
jgi:hypothetical protein